MAIGIDLPLRAARDLLAMDEAIAFGVCLVVWGLVPPLLRRGLSLDDGARLFVLPALVMMGLNAINSGGVMSPATAWIAMMPLAAAIVGTWRVAFETFVLCLSLLLSLYFGWVPVKEDVVGNSVHDWFGNFLTIATVTWLASTFYEYQVDSERAALVKEQVSFQSLANEMPAAVVVVDKAGHCVYFNRHAAMLFPELQPGTRFEERVGLDPWALPRLADRKALTVAGAEGPRELEVRARSITFQGMPCLLFTAVDRTLDVRAEQHRAELQRRLQEAEKLEGLGMLAGGVAHDFNNLLTPLKLASASLMADPDDGEEVRACAQDIHAVVERAETLVQGIRLYAGQSSAVFHDVELLPMISKLTALLAAGRGRSVRVTMQEGVGGIAKAEPATLQRVLENLVVNALDATSATEGEVVVSIGQTQISSVSALDGERCLPASPRPGSYVCVDVQDNGPGIDPEHHERLFEPFFTTKASGQGLGLAQVLGGVRQLGGTLLVRTEVGVGTRFRVLLAPGEGKGHRSRVEDGALPPHASGTLLVVDDEPMVLKQLVRVLESGGWTVVGSTNPRRASELFAENPARFRGAVLDFLMPQLNGADLARELLELREGLPIVLCSGYIEGSTAIDLEKAGFAGVIRKPFEASELLWTVWRAAGGEDPSAPG